MSNLGDFLSKMERLGAQSVQKVFLICLEYPLCMYKIEIKYRMLCYRAAVEPPGLTRLAFCRYQLRDW